MRTDLNEEKKRIYACDFFPTFSVPLVELLLTFLHY